MHKFYFCKSCKNIVYKIIDSSIPIECCGSKMLELVPNTVEASKEKHIPVVTNLGGIIHVSIGEVPHPMEENHYIEFIYLETMKCHQMIKLYPGDKPEAYFPLFENDTVKAAFAYCNIHGLWKK